MLALLILILAVFLSQNSYALLSVAQAKGLVDTELLSGNSSSLLLEGCAVVRSNTLQALMQHSPKKLKTLMKLIFRETPDGTQILMQLPEFSIAGNLEAKHWLQLDNLLSMAPSKKDLEMGIVSIFKEGDEKQILQFAKTFGNAFHLCQSLKFLDPYLLRLIVNAAACLKTESIKDLHMGIDNSSVAFTPEDYKSYCMDGMFRRFDKKAWYLCLYGEAELGPDKMPQPIRFMTLTVTSFILSDCTETALLNVLAYSVYDKTTRTFDADRLKTRIGESMSNQKLMEFFRTYRNFESLRSTSAHRDFILILSELEGISFKRPSNGLEMHSSYDNLNKAIYGFTGFLNISSLADYLNKRYGSYLQVGDFKPNEGEGGAFNFSVWGNRFEVEYVHVPRSHSYFTDPEDGSIDVSTCFLNVGRGGSKMNGGIWDEFVYAHGINHLGYKDYSSLDAFSVFLRVMIQLGRGTYFYSSTLGSVFTSWLKDRKCSSHELQLFSSIYDEIRRRNVFVELIEMIQQMKDSESGNLFFRHMLKVEQNYAVVSDAVLFGLYLESNLAPEEIIRDGGINMTVTQLKYLAVKKIQELDLTDGFFFGLHIMQKMEIANVDVNRQNMKKRVDLVTLGEEELKSLDGGCDCLPLHFAFVSASCGGFALEVFLDLQFPFLDKVTMFGKYNLLHLAVLAGNGELVKLLMEMDYNLYNDLFETNWTIAKLLKSKDEFGQTALDMANLMVHSNSTSSTLFKMDSAIEEMVDRFEDFDVFECRILLSLHEALQELN